MSVYRQSWLEIIGKTIAMIHASPSYQRYVRHKRLLLLRESDSLAIGRRTHYLKEKALRECTECNAQLLRHSKTGMCMACLKKTIVASLRSGLSISETADKLGLCSPYVLLILNPKQKKISPKPVSRLIVTQAESIAEDAFKHQEIRESEKDRLAEAGAFNRQESANAR